MPINELPETAKKVLNLIHGKLATQCEKGYEKYGQSIDQAKGYDWNQMALEETIDGMQYLMKENSRIKGEIKSLIHALDIEKQKLMVEILSGVNMREDIIRGEWLSELEGISKILKRTIK